MSVLSIGFPGYGLVSSFVKQESHSQQAGNLHVLTLRKWSPFIKNL